MTASDHKIVSIITLIIIGWGMFEVGTSINAWLEYKLNGIEVPFNIWFHIPHILLCIYSIIIHGLVLNGISAENPKFLYVWLLSWYIFVFRGLSMVVFWVSKRFQGPRNSGTCPLPIF